MAASRLSAASGLLVLPDELLLEVLHYIDSLTDPWRTKSLYGISLTSRRLHGLSQSFLYSTFSFYAGIPYLFLRTISIDPDLASQVKVVRWDYDTVTPSSFVYKPGVLAVKQDFQVDAARNELKHMAAQGNDIAKQLVANLKLGRLYLGDHRALEVLLMFTPNLEHLEVVETYRWDDHHYWFTPILCGPNDFSRLTSAALQGPMRLENIYGLMLLPAMRRLELTQVIEMRQELGREFQWRDPFNRHVVGQDFFNRRSSNLEHLHLLESYISFIDIKHIVRNTQSLKSFVYEHERNDLSIEYLKLPYDEIDQFLEQHRESLTSIRISLKHASDPILLPAPWDDENILFDAAQDCLGLTDLELPYSSSQWLYHAPDWEKLPPNLEHLTIDYLSARMYIEHGEGTVELEKGLEELMMRKRRGELPELRSLVFKNWHPFYSSFPRDISIGTMLEEVGIQLSSMPGEIGSTIYTMEDIGWVELQTEPEWVIIESYRVREAWP